MAKTILSSDQLHTLHHTIYEPTTEAKATLLIVHGMSEHSGRYEDFAKYLAEHGIAVLTYDQLGHGRTIRNAEEMGYFSKAYPVQTLLKDVIIMANTLKQSYPDLPHFIMGHSMGSFITRNVLQNHSNAFKGAILMGSSDYDPLVKTMLPIASLMNKLKPKSPNLAFSKIMNKILNSKIKEKKHKSEFAWIARNPNTVKAYEEDPLCGFDFTNNGFKTLFQLMDTGLAKNWAETIELDFPMLFISGEDDPVGNMGKGIHKLIKRMKKQEFTNVEKQLYPLMRHEPLHEEDNDMVYEDILNWIEALIH